MASEKDGPSSSASSSPAPEVVKSSKKRKSAPADEIEVDLNLPEPPSKKARRALKKGKPLKSKASPSKKNKKQRADDDDDDDDDLPARLRSDTEGGGDGSSKKERSKHGVWIGNLRFTTTRADLFRWLVESSGGSITEDAITRVNLPLSKPKREGKSNGSSGDGGAAAVAPRENKGFAYVDFATYEACIAAIALSESEMNGRKLLIKDSKSFEGRPAPAAAATPLAGTNGASAGDTAAATAPPVSTNSKIYVGNLPFDANEDSLWTQFEKCGAIQWAKVATFEDSGKCKGYGWVKFAEPAAAQWAVRGFVKIKETVETEADFVSDDDGDDDDDEAAAAEDEQGGDEKRGDEDDDEDDDDGNDKNKAKKKRSRRAGGGEAEKTTKTRKWWVNRFKGRTLTIQLAEDDQTRYKKRFGKDAPKRVRPGKPQGRTAPDADKPSRPASGAATDGGAKKAINYHDDINVARLTGAAVAPRGKKVAFD